ncbi:MAG: kelch repeat-containing protein [Archangium sp.]|nr:kelch repeat-containing protein [Archangium sp.]MDP3153621.1 kelch repeat-containing protein [Archangium sp.]MDP3576388.1 kelch repeat-containing protein [Archangium sp.]
MMEDAGVTDAGVTITLVPKWKSTTDAPVSMGVWGTVLSFDPIDRRFIMHGGNTSTNAVSSDTWSFSIATKQWTKLTTTGDAPPVRYCHCAAYLPGQKQVLIVGGRNQSALVNTAYTLDLQTLAWTQVTGTVPTGAIGCTAHWMPTQQRVIVFGGDSPSGVNDRTWSYDPAARTFTQLMPATPAFARRDAMSIYDPVQDRLFMFGGAIQIRQQYLDDVAVFDGTNWADFSAPDPHPTRRRYGASGYDALHAKWLLFSGTNDTDDFDDLWVIDTVTFEFKRVMATGPAKRGFAASGVDEVTGTLYVFGGLTTPRQDSLVDGWTLQLTEE